MAQTPSAKERRSWLRLGRALQHRNFRLFFLGQSVSLIGTWMQQLGVSWLVYTLTGDAFLLGAVAFAGQIPGFFLVPLAGVFIDRWNKQRLIVMTQLLLMVQALLLAVLTPGIAVWQLAALSFLQGCLTAFDLPARQSFLPELLDDRGDLANAIALNSSVFHSARLIGPTLAAAVIALAGVELCFLLNGLSYAALIVALLRMRVPPRGTPIPPLEAGQPRQGVLHGLGEGVRYAFGFPPMRAILLLAALVSLFGAPYTVLLPLFAARVFGGDAAVLGLLMTAGGLGALAGSLYLASRTSVLGLGRSILLACSAFSVGLMIFSQSAELWLAVPAMVLVGLGMMLTLASCNTILQTIVDDDKRGRVMSLFALAITGLAPFGALLAGTAADAWGAPTAVLVGGGICLAGVLLFARRFKTLRRQVRPIYVARGILSESGRLPSSP